MKHLYFVRHAEPDHDWKVDSTRPLSAEGASDCALVTQALLNIEVNRFISSPYKRSCDTISGSADAHGMDIVTDERLRERDRGKLPNSWDIMKKRWEDFDFNEEVGESLRMVQKRNSEAILELLSSGTPSESIVVGTHGTALATIFNYFDPLFGFEDFKRIIDYMPYIIRLDFEGQKCVGKEELLIIKKPFFDRYKKNLFIRKLEISEIPEALRLVWDTFVEFEAPDYAPEGVNKFREYLDDRNFIGGLTINGAFLHGLLAGVLATRNSGSHIAMFFVRKEYQRHGIGHKLFDYMLNNCPLEQVTVNSSPYAVFIYEKLGFIATDTEQTSDGIRFTPMTYSRDI